jgi:hypothetical protein
MAPRRHELHAGDPRGFYGLVAPSHYITFPNALHVLGQAAVFCCSTPNSFFISSTTLDFPLHLCTLCWAVFLDSEQSDCLNDCLSIFVCVRPNNSPTIFCYTCFLKTCLLKYCNNLTDKFCPRRLGSIKETDITCSLQYLIGFFSLASHYRQESFLETILTVARYRATIVSRKPFT